MEKEFLDKYELKLGEVIMADKKHVPIYEDLKSGHEVSYTAGGATQNVFRSFQWMLGEGEKCGTFVGCIGKDAFGEEMKKEIGGAGVDARYMETTEAPTGTCACLIHEKERTLVSYLGAAEKYDRKHFDTEEIQNLMKKAKFYYFSGFYITVAPEVMLEIAKHSRENNKTFAINLSAEFVIKFFWPKMKPIVDIADYLFCNEMEARCLSESMGWKDETGDDVMKIAVKFAKELPYDKDHPKHIIFTQGTDPLCVVIQTGEKEVSQQQFDVLTSDKVVDTNGAGDSFVGGFFSQLVKGKDLATCVKAAMYVSKIIVETSGIKFPKEKPNF